MERRLGRVIVPGVLGLSILIALATFADAGKVIGALRAFHLEAALPIVVLIAGYEAIRGVLWFYLLRRLDVRPPLRSVTFAYALGEITKYSPAGNYVPNYLLRRIRRASFGLSSAATTYIPYSEIGICLLALLILGLDGWTWLRPAILAGTVIVALMVWGMLRWQPPLPRWLRTRPTLWKEAIAFRKGARDLLTPRVVIIVAITVAGYLILEGAAFYVIAQGVGVSTLTFPQALSAFLFALVFTLLVPLPTDIGSLEASGTGALLAFGVSRYQAVAIMLLNRVFTLGVAFAAALLVTALFREQVRSAVSD